jgi:hypothetical protein
MPIECAASTEKFRRDKDKGPDGDPTGKVTKDTQGLIHVTQAVVPATSKKHRRIVEVLLTFTPNAERVAHWSNKAEPLRVWIDVPKTGTLGSRFVEFPNPKEPISTDERTVSFEVKTPSKQKGSLTIDAYALYHVCEGDQGEPKLRRQDIKVKIDL